MTDIIKLEKILLNRELNGLNTEINSGNNSLGEENGLKIKRFIVEAKLESVKRILIRKKRRCQKRR